MDFARETAALSAHLRFEVPSPAIEMLRRKSRRDLGSDIEADRQFRKTGATGVLSRQPSDAP
jgi:hypothetical protein